MHYRYLVTILPSPAFSGDVDRLKALVREHVGSFSGRRTVPHITLCFLDLPAEHESAVIAAIAHGATDQQGFTLSYNGITHFPDKRTIYIDPVEKEAIAAVRTPIIAALKDNDDLRDAVRETDHPHLTIAAGLKPVQFEKAWGLLAPHQLRCEEYVDEVVLLKRRLVPGTTYEHVHSFPLS